MKNPVQLCRPGALVDRQIRNLIEAGVIECDCEGSVQPASLDLRVGEVVYQVSGQPSPPREGGFEPEQFVNRFAINKFDLRKSGVATLMPGGVYMAPVMEKFHVIDDLNGYSNPKSSTGRTDISTVLIREGESRFNTVSKLGDRQMWVIIKPRSFPVMLARGISLVQLRLFKGLQRNLSREEHIYAQKQYQIVHDADPIFDEVGGLTLHLDLSRGHLTSLSCQRPVDLRTRDAPLNRYFHTRHEEENHRGGKIIFLEEDQFLLAATKERIAIPPILAATMAPYREDMGDFISHYAGFFDNGFGYSAGVFPEASAATVVCEIRNISGGPQIFEDGQPVGSLQFEWTSETPDQSYSGNYAEQKTVRFAKFFSEQ